MRAISTAYLATWSAHPYLLRGLTIERPNHVWAADITYIPMAKGFLYLEAIIDWTSRAVLAWMLSNTMDTAFCLVALPHFGKPEIFYNTRRFHQALVHKTSMVVWSAGKTAMDMPLRLDNARALPTCPQPRNAKG